VALGYTTGEFIVKQPARAVVEAGNISYEAIMPLLRSSSCPLKERRSDDSW
jgi:hypothetical protein